MIQVGSKRPTLLLLDPHLLHPLQYVTLGFQRKVSKGWKLCSILLHSPHHPQLHLCNYRGHFCNVTIPPYAQGFIASLAKLHLLPFQFMKLFSFCEFMAYATPHWQVPSHHYLAQKSISIPYQYIECNVSVPLDHPLSGRVHMIASIVRNATYPVTTKCRTGHHWSK